MLLQQVFKMPVSTNPCLAVIDVDIIKVTISLCYNFTMTLTLIIWNPEISKCYTAQSDTQGRTVGRTVGSVRWQPWRHRSSCCVGTTDVEIVWDVCRSSALSEPTGTHTGYSL